MSAQSDLKNKIKTNPKLERFVREYVKSYGLYVLDMCTFTGTPDSVKRSLRELISKHGEFALKQAIQLLLEEKPKPSRTEAMVDRIDSKKH